MRVAVTMCRREIHSRLGDVQQVNHSCIWAAESYRRTAAISKPSSVLRLLLQSFTTLPLALPALRYRVSVRTELFAGRKGEMLPR